MLKSLLVLTLGCALALTSCGDSRSCSVDDDCFSGEYCSGTTCVEGERPGETRDEGRTNSNTPSDAGRMETSNNESDFEIRGEACQVDPFDAPPCELQESQFEYFEARTVGCQNEGWVGLDKTISSTLCIRETLNRYTQLYVDCDDVSFVVEVTFTPKVECNPALYSFDVSFAGHSCGDADTSDSIECTTLEDGSRRVRVIIPPGRHVSGGNIRIEALEPDTIQLDYDLRVVIRQ